MKITSLILFWLLLISGAFHFLMNYSSEEGRIGKISNSLPRDSKLTVTHPFELIMFIHPGRSCSQASLSELSRLMAREPELQAQVVFMKTKKLDPLFKNNPLLQKTVLIPRTKIFFDEDGAEARLFGALTSGHTFLYGEGKNLLFHGGLTAARAHEGKSSGQEAIEKILKRQPSRKIASVFGCDIFGSLFKLEKK